MMRDKRNRGIPLFLFIYTSNEYFDVIHFNIYIRYQCSYISIY